MRIRYLTISSPVKRISSSDWLLLRIRLTDEEAARLRVLFAYYTQRLGI